MTTEPWTKCPHCGAEFNLTKVADLQALADHEHPDLPPSVPVPAYVDPKVLKPGTTVTAVLDGSQTRLVVLRVEPLVVCRTPDGQEINLFAHEVVPTDDEPIPFRRFES